MNIQIKGILAFIRTQHLCSFGLFNSRCSHWISSTPLITKQGKAKTNGENVQFLEQQSQLTIIEGKASQKLNRYKESKLI